MFAFNEGNTECAERATESGVSPGRGDGRSRVGVVGTAPVRRHLRGAEQARQRRAEVLLHDRRRRRRRPPVGGVGSGRVARRCHGDAQPLLLLVVVRLIQRNLHREKKTIRRFIFHSFPCLLESRIEFRQKKTKSKHRIIGLIHSKSIQNLIRN